MSDQTFGHEMWLSRLKEHLQQERYAARTTERCLVVARYFLASIQKQNVDVSKARQADVERYLQQERRKYSHRHGHPPDYKGWRGVYSSSVHMLLRLAQGHWPSSKPTEELQQELCGTYAQWMTGARGFLRSRSLIAVPKHVVSLAGSESVIRRTDLRPSRLE